ncbi:MAG: hypothetical protein R3F39_03800 [Myxococcota bacterium]
MGAAGGDRGHELKGVDCRPGVAVLAVAMAELARVAAAPAGDEAVGGHGAGVLGAASHVFYIGRT